MRNVFIAFLILSAGFFIFSQIDNNWTKYSTCQFEFEYPRKWGGVYKSQLQKNVNDLVNDENYILTTNIYRFSNKDNTRIVLANNNVGLFWYDVNTESWGKHEPHKVNLKNLCEYAERTPPTNTKYSINYGVKECLITDGLATLRWSFRDNPDYGSYFTLAGFKELFNDKFSGAAIILESQEIIEDKGVLNRVMKSVLVKDC